MKRLLAIVLAGVMALCMVSCGSEESGETNNVATESTDFKEAMDSYEEFMDEYVSFMKEYLDNPTDVGLLSKYTEFSSDYSDVVGKFNEWKDKNLTEEEMEYYIEVQERVAKKLSEVQ